jgi:hypothetical protein
MSSVTFGSQKAAPFVHYNSAMASWFHDSERLPATFDASPQQSAGVRPIDDCESGVPLRTLQARPLTTQLRSFNAAIVNDRFCRRRPFGRAEADDSADMDRRRIIGVGFAGSWFLAQH